METRKAETPANILIRLAKENGARFWHLESTGPGDTPAPLVTFHPQGWKESITTGVTDKKFQSWLAYLYHKETGQTVRYYSMNEATSHLCGLALYRRGSGFTPKPRRVEP